MSYVKMRKNNKQMSRKISQSYCPLSIFRETIIGITSTYE